MTTYLKILIFFLFAVALALPLWTSRTVEGQSATEAPTGFDTLTNDATFVSQATHDAESHKAQAKPRCEQCRICQQRCG